MRILVTNHWLKKLGGSETFTYTLIGELIRLGHDVDFWTLHEGLVSETIQRDYRIVKRLRGCYDVILANHNTTVDQVSHLGPTIQTCHGVYPKLEQPSAKAHRYVAISEEIMTSFRDLYEIKMSVIRNGIDCNRFRPETWLNPKIESVLSLSHSEELNNTLQEIFDGYGIRLIRLNKFKNPVWSVEKIINQVDLVVSLGRGVYESWACGRPVLVLDQRPYMRQLGDGMVTPENFHQLISHNCSGRLYQRTDVKRMVDEAIELYDQDLQETWRDFALREFDIQKQVKKYRELWKELISSMS